MVDWPRKGYVHMRGAVKFLLWAGLVMNLWVLLGYLVIHENAGDQAFMRPKSILTCAVLVLAPALTFIPIASRIQAPLFDLEATVGWATLGFVVTFTSPASPLERSQFLMLLLPLIVALGSMLTLVAYAFVRRLHDGDPFPGQFVRARREGYLASIVIVFLLLLHSLGILGPFNALLAVTSAVLAEALLLARGSSVPVSDAS